METTKDKISSSNCLVSSKQTNWTVKRMYQKEKIPHLRTEMSIMKLKKKLASCWKQIS